MIGVEERGIRGSTTGNALACSIGRFGNYVAGIIGTFTSFVGIGFVSWKGPLTGTFVCLSFHNWVTGDLLDYCGVVFFEKGEGNRGNFGPLGLGVLDHHLGVVGGWVTEKMWGRDIAWRGNWVLVWGANNFLIFDCSGYAFVGEVCNAKGGVNAS